MLLIQYIGIRPNQQITALRELSNQRFRNKDLYNLNASFNRQRNKGLAPTDALIEDLKAQHIPYVIHPDKDGFTEHLFIALSESLELARQNQDIILVDNTYKTNKFGMPLLHVVGRCLQVLLMCFSGAFGYFSGAFGCFRVLVNYYKPENSK